jgi:hypothetical protein
MCLRVETIEGRSRGDAEIAEVFAKTRSSRAYARDLGGRVDPNKAGNCYRRSLVAVRRGPTHGTAVDGRMRGGRTILSVEP